MLDFRTMVIQVCDAAGRSMGDALVPDSIHRRRSGSCITRKET